MCIIKIELYGISGRQVSISPLGKHGISGRRFSIFPLGKRRKASSGAGQKNFFSFKKFFSLQPPTGSLQIHFSKMRPADGVFRPLRWAAKGSAFGIRQSSLPLRSAPWLCATGTRRPFIKGGRKFYIRVYSRCEQRPNSTRRQLPALAAREQVAHYCALPCELRQGLARGVKRLQRWMP